MHSSQLAELGSWVAVNSANLIYGEQEQPMLIGSIYWTASKIRLQRWVTALKMFELDFQRNDAQQNDAQQNELAEPIEDWNTTPANPAPDRKPHNPWPALEIVVQEILMSEMLTRIWSASVLTHDWYHHSDEMHGLAHSVHVSHMEAKNRAIRIMLHGQIRDESAFDRMNALRRRMERWTDLFLGQLPGGEQAAMFGFDRNRVKDFNREQRETVGPEYLTRQKILTASLATDLVRNQIPYAANPDLNREIAAGVLACFPSDRFDAQGLPKSARMIWLEKSHQDTQVLVNQLFDFEENAGTRNPL